MGYTTDFNGSFAIDPPLTEPQRAYLAQFSETRRVTRDPDLVAELSDPLREAVGLPVGRFGEFFVGAGGFRGQEIDHTVTDHNLAPGQRPSRFIDGRIVPTGVGYGDDRAQPGLWCQWIPTEDGTELVWDQGEKFYHYVDWLKYLQKHILSVWGCKLTGRVDWFGEDRDDFGVILAENGAIRAFGGRLSHPDKEQGEEA